MLTRTGAASRFEAPPDPPPLVAERLSDRLAARLGEQIDAGSLRPGDRLPTEERLAAAHGVSRTVVREAVHQLKSRGLLRSRQGSGVYVTAAPPRDALTFDFSLIRSLDDVLRIREVRRALEAETAALAAERRSRTQVAALRRALRAIDRSTAERRDGVQEDLAFHRLLADAAGNPHFGRLLEFLEQYSTVSMRVTRRNDASRADFIEAVRVEHAAIVDAIDAGDPALARRRAVPHMRGGDRRLRTAGPLLA
jgi:GntR family transcriptional repressor for pyruvate dehydrogenase complex